MVNLRYLALNLFFSWLVHGNTWYQLPLIAKDLSVLKYLTKVDPVTSPLNHHKHTMNSQLNHHEMVLKGIP